jgi:uncharacterized protein (DUF1501 family)
MHRRVFLKSGAMALVTLGLTPSFLRRAIFAQELPRAKRGKILICLFQRGAADGLNIVVPHGDPSYYTLRPNIAVPRPAASAGAAGAIDLDGFFGLHPSLAPFKDLWDHGMLAPIQAVGSPSNSRSHFDAQDFMETGTPDVKGTPDGWLNRYLAVKGTCAECDAGKPSPFRSVAFAQQTPRILEGPQPTIAMSTLADFTVRATGSDVSRLEALYRTGSADIVHGAGAETFDAVKLLKSANPEQYQPANGAEYPRSQFAQSLRQIAQLIKSDVGLEIAFADVGGWDTHVNQGGATGQLATRLDDFGKSIHALVTDLGDRMGDVVILTMSEFGRTPHQNGSGGTDHGHATSFFVIGGDVKGKKVYGKWPGLAPEHLYEGRDLALTTDFRSVFSEILAHHLGAARIDPVFPGFTERPQDWLGIV